MCLFSSHFLVCSCFCFLHLEMISSFSGMFGMCWFSSSLLCFCFCFLHCWKKKLQIVLQVCVHVFIVILPPVCIFRWCCSWQCWSFVTCYQPWSLWHLRHPCWRWRSWSSVTGKTNDDSRQAKTIICTVVMHITITYLITLKCPLSWQFMYLALVWQRNGTGMAEIVPTEILLSESINHGMAPAWHFCFGPCNNFCRCWMGAVPDRWHECGYPLDDMNVVNLLGDVNVVTLLDDIAMMTLVWEMIEVTSCISLGDSFLQTVFSLQGRPYWGNFFMDGMMTSL